MARRIVHIHIHRHTRDSAPTPREALVNRLFELIEKEEARNRASTSDEEEGHAFHGNQYTNVAGGPKPTKAVSTHSKKAVHELLSSGHPFSIKELMDATGAQEITVKTALSVLKNEKYASGLGLSALSIKKHPDGTFQLMEGAQPAPAAPAPDLEAIPETPLKGLQVKAPKKVQTVNPKAPALPEGAGIKTTQAASFTANPPATVMPKDEADKVYKKSLQDATIAAVAGVHGGVFTPEQAAKHWKAAKAQHMAQWAANTKGSAHTPTPTEVYPEDVELIEDLLNLQMDKGSLSSDDIEKSIQLWKDETATAKHKKATAPPPGPTATKAPTPASHKPGPATVSHETPAAMKVPEAKGPALPAPPKEYVPKSWKGVTADDFASGPNKQPLFSKRMKSLKSALFTDHEEPVTNKKDVQKQLETKLKESPHFQHWQQLYEKKMGVPSASLAAKLVNHWAGNSGDHHPVPVAMQHAVQQAFGMDKKDVELSHLAGGDKATWESVTADALKSSGLSGNPLPQEVASFHNALKDFVLAQYHSTQELFKQHGITTVCVARGMSGHAGSHAEVVNLKLQPASSFSTNLSTAVSGFAGGGSVYLAQVPVSQVLGSFRSGFGCTNEHEVVVLSHPNSKAVCLAPNKAGGSVDVVAAQVGKEVKEWH